MSSGSKLAYEGPADLPRVRATSTDLIQIFVNLVRNAQQALEEHGLAHGTIIVNAVVGPRELTLSVTDDGPGIPSDVLGRLGTPFYTTREAGTGLGVAQVKRLVGRLGGELSIESTIGKGTTATFTLPIVESDPN